MNQCTLYHNLSNKYTVKTAPSPMRIAQKWVPPPGTTPLHLLPVSEVRLGGWGQCVKTNLDKKDTPMIDGGSAGQRHRNTPESQHVPLFLLCASPPAISVPLSFVSPFFINDNCAAQHFCSPDFGRSRWGRVYPSVQTM